MPNEEFELPAPTDNDRPFATPLIQEPLLHFLAIAALLFAANAFFAGDERKLITVSTEAQEFLIGQQTDLLMRPLSEDEQADVIGNFIDEEILANEARKQGFDNSSRIRTLLVQNMRYFLTSDVPLPDEQDLRRYFDENPQRFETPPTASYDVLRLRGNDLPADAAARLNRGDDPADVFGAGSMNESRLLKIDGRTLAAMFGPERTADIVAIDDDQWHGPFATAQGLHFLRVRERQAAGIPDFETIEGWVDAEWTRSEHLRVIEESLKTMRSNYRIEVADVDTKAVAGADQ